MIVIDANGNMAGGTTTNGASHKVPGYEFNDKSVMIKYLFNIII
jgi:hypothetical protein